MNPFLRPGGTAPLMPGMGMNIPKIMPSFLLFLNIQLKNKIRKCSNKVESFLCHNSKSISLEFNQAIYLYCLV